MNTLNMIYPVVFALLAGISTGIGGILVLFIKKADQKLLSFMLGFSAGIMIYLSFIEIYPEAQAILCNFHGLRNGKILAILSFFLGVILMAFINAFFPDTGQPHQPKKVNPKTCSGSLHKSGNLFKTGLFTALAVTIHNFPEGIATFISGMKNTALGISIALAIAIHNIPEGIAISIPIYYSTKSKKKAFFLSLISGLSEPLGAILTMLILGPIITDTVFGITFGSVAGIMVYISLDELLPASREYGEHALSMAGMMIGILVLSIGSIFIF